MEAARLHWTENLGRAIKGQAAAAFAYRWPVTKVGWAMICAAAFLGMAGALAVCAMHSRGSSEHGPLENFQALALALGALTFGAHAVAVAAPRRIVSAGLALLCLIFLLLEFDTRAFDMPALRRWTNGAVRNAWLGALAVIYGLALLRSFRKAWSASLQWLGTRAGLLMVISGGFWIAGGIFEANAGLLGSTIALMLEEVMEVDAALFMAWSAVWTVRGRGSAI